MGKLHDSAQIQVKTILLNFGKIHPAVSEICVLVHGQSHMCQMGKWTITAGQDISKELQMPEKICPADPDICMPHNLDPTGTRFDKYLAHAQAQMGQMSKQVQFIDALHQN